MTGENGTRMMRTIREENKDKNSSTLMRTIPKGENAAIYMVKAIPKKNIYENCVNVNCV